MIDTLIELRPAADAPRADFVAALNRAYADYYVPIRLNATSFLELVERESIRLESSLAAWDDGQIVGLGLMGVRAARGWVGGMGVVPERRRQGIGRRIMVGLIAEARRLGLATLQLEVIIRNEPAYRLYQGLGFRRVRHLSALFTSDTAQAIRARAPEGIAVQDADPADLLGQIARLAATAPAWQYDIDSVLPIIGRVKGLAARRADGSLAGLCLWTGDDDQGAILGLASRSEKVGAALIAEVRRRLPMARLNYLAVPDDDPMLPVLLAAGFSEALGQHEMILELGQKVKA